MSEKPAPLGARPKRVEEFQRMSTGVGFNGPPAHTPWRRPHPGDATDATAGHRRPRSSSRNGNEASPAACATRPRSGSV